MSTSIYWDIFSNSIPLMISCVFQAVIETINIHYATSKQMMTGIGIATILVHCVGGSLTLGFNTGYCTLASRAFGAGNKLKFKQALRQGLTNLGIMSLFFGLLAMSSYQIVRLTGQNEAIATYAYKTMIYHLPGLLFYYVADFMWCYLNAQKVFKPIITIFLVGLGVHGLLSLLISKQYGFNGIVISTNISFFVIMVISIYLACKNGEWKLTWDMFEVEDPYDDYYYFTKESLYVAVPYCLNLFVFEFMTLYLGSFKMTDQTSANVAITNLECIIVAPHFGCSIYAMTRISHFIGENRPDQIKKLIKSTMILSLCTIYSILIVAQIFRNQLADYYFFDHSPRKYFFIILNYFFFRVFLSSVKMNGSFILRGLGLGSELIKWSIFCYYIVGIGSIITLCKYMEVKILAVWIGFGIGDVTMILVFVYYACKIDIDETTQTLYERVKVEDEKNTVNI